MQKFKIVAIDNITSFLAVLLGNKVDNDCITGKESHLPSVDHLFLLVPQSNPT